MRDNVVYCLFISWFNFTIVCVCSTNNVREGYCARCGATAWLNWERWLAWQTAGGWWRCSSARSGTCCAPETLWVVGEPLPATWQSSPPYSALLPIFWHLTWTASSPVDSWTALLRLLLCLAHKYFIMWVKISLWKKLETDWSITEVKWTMTLKAPVNKNKKCKIRNMGFLERYS